MSQHEALFRTVSPAQNFYTIISCFLYSGHQYVKLLCINSHFWRERSPKQIVILRPSPTLKQKRNGIKRNLKKWRKTYKTQIKQWANIVGFRECFKIRKSQKNSERTPKEFRKNLERIPKEFWKNCERNLKNFRKISKSYEGKLLKQHLK